jgi:hypothetical protein
MKLKSRVGFAVLLATVLILNASALCAVPFTQVSQPAHPCCPVHQSSHRDTTQAHCCLSAGAPVIPPAVSGPGNVLWTSSWVAGPAAIQLPAAEAVAVVRPLLASSPLFLQFHQLLI